MSTPAWIKIGMQVRVKDFPESSWLPGTLMGYDPSQSHPFIVKWGGANYSLKWKFCEPIEEVEKNTSIDNAPDRVTRVLMFQPLSVELPFYVEFDKPLTDLIRRVGNSKPFESVEYIRMDLYDEVAGELSRLKEEYSLLLTHLQDLAAKGVIDKILKDREDPDSGTGTF